MQAEALDPAPIHSSERGNGPQTLVLVHGFGAHHGIWDALTAALAHKARTIAYDLPGHGLSLETPGAGSAKFAARAILSDLSRRSMDTAHVVGHSMGGAVAVLMALAEPRRIASLTLLAPGGFGPEIDGPLLRRYAQAGDRAELHACLSAMSGENAAVPDSVLDSGVAMRKTPGQSEKLVEIAAAITRDDRQGVILHELLASLAMPVTVLWGTRDPVVPFTQASTLPPHFELRTAPGAGHMLVEETPGLVREAILANLARTD